MKINDIISINIIDETFTTGIPLKFKTAVKSFIHHDI